MLVGGVASIVAVGEWVCPGRPCWTGSPLRLAQGRSVDANGLALVSQAAEQGLSEVFVAKQARPLVIFKVRCNQRGLAAAAFFHEFEKNIRLLGAQVEVSDFIDEKAVETRPASDEFARGAVGEGSVHLVEQVLSADEQPAIAVLQSLQQEPGRQSRFAELRLDR